MRAAFGETGAALLGDRLPVGGGISLIGVPRPEVSFDLGLVARRRCRRDGRLVSRRSLGRHKRAKQDRHGQPRTVGRIDGPMCA